jgi:sterol desaturase/sphingolipid hydroxylase (fatty acid hydroxylase superfamily)
MNSYLEIFLSAYSGYWNYLTNEILNPSWNNYFYWLIALSLLVWLAEIAFPWRKSQSIVRKDFWLDGFYMFFNFFIFSLVLYNGVSMVGVKLFENLLNLIGIQNLVAIEISQLPRIIQLLIMFVLADFIQWNIHRLLHRIDWLWQFHKVHHSVKEMGFAAHLRFHWMETVVYKTLQYIPLAMIGFGISDFFIIHIISISIGHLNHSNINLSYGPLKYILNNPKMHIWHHAKELPKERRYGVNFGLSLSIWDYLFKTSYLPSDGKNIELGFNKDEKFPTTFWKQLILPFFSKK